MRPIQQDDIQDWFNKGKKDKDCIHTYYKVFVDGKKIKEGRYAVKQTKNIENRTIYYRKWNESKRTWIGEWCLKN